MRYNKETGIYAAVTFITALGVAAGSILSPVEVRFLETLTSNTALIGARFSFGAAVGGLFSLFVGMLANKSGKKIFIAFGAILGVIYPLLYAHSSNIFQYMGFSIVAAFSGASLWPLMSSILQDSLVNTKSRGRLLGISYSIAAVMGSAGALAGGIIADSYGLVAPFYAVASISILAALVTFAFLVKYNNHKSLIINKNPEKRDILFALRYILHDKLLIFHLIIQTVFGLYWTIKPIIYPLAIYAISKNNTATGSTFAIMGIVAMIVLPFAGHYVDKKGYLKGAKIGYAILCISSLALAFSETFELFFIFAGLFAVGEAINGPMVGVIEVKRIKSKHRSELMGFYYAHSALLSIISPLIAGVLLMFVSVSNVLLIYSGFLWVGFFLGWFFLKNKNYSK